MPDFRFSRAARLLLAEDFKRVFAAPTRSADSYFTVLARFNERGSARLGLAISKKQARRAVDRNRLKRIARETFRRQRPALASMDIIVMVRAVALHADNQQLAASLERHFSKFAILPSTSADRT